MDMEITFPKGQYVEGRYKEYTVRMGPSEKPWWEGPKPGAFDMFVMSIGFCTAAVLWTFMGHRDLPVKDMRMILRRHTDQETHMITSLETILYMPKDFPEKYREAIARAADACAVKQHMMHPPKFTNEVYIGDEREDA